MTPTLQQPEQSKKFEFETASKKLERMLSMNEAEIKCINPLLSKFKIRIPLLLYAWIGGLLSGLTAAILKIAAEFIQAEGFYESLGGPLVWICGVVLLVNCLYMFKSLNRGMKYYNQLEVIPIYQSSVIINHILAGGLILGEFRFYEWWRIVFIMVGAMVCCFGILIIIRKYHYMREMQKVEVFEGDTSGYFGLGTS